MFLSAVLPMLLAPTLTGKFSRIKWDKELFINESREKIAVAFLKGRFHK